MVEKMTCGRRNDLLAWGSGEREKDYWRSDSTCSHCGSLHPEVFLDLVVQGTMVIPTDKDYKAYIGDSSRKFYFQHLSAEQRLRFIQLYNDMVMQIDYPGYFYVNPYFCKHEPA